MTSASTSTKPSQDPRAQTVCPARQSMLFAHFGRKESGTREANVGSSMRINEFRPQPLPPSRPPQPRTTTSQEPLRPIHGSRKVGNGQRARIAPADERRRVACHMQWLPFRTEFQDGMDRGDLRGLRGICIAKITRESRRFRWKVSATCVGPRRDLSKCATWMLTVARLQTGRTLNKAINKGAC